MLWHAVLCCAVPFLNSPPCPAPQVNGKKLQPARGAFASFMLPLACWWVAALVIFGVSFNSVQQLQAPLTSLQV
jgi:hypothetical protein